MNTDSETEEISNERSLYLNPGSDQVIIKTNQEMTFWEKFKYSIKILFDCCGRL